MENKLKNLKGKMNETVLQDVSFDEELEQRVLHSIKKSKFSKRNKFNAVLSVAVTGMIFLGIAYFVGMQLHKQGNVASESKEKVSETTQPTTIYTPPKQEENYNDMTKEEILTKMLNTVDHFETAKGEFEINYRNIPSNSVVSYEISLKNNIGGFSKTISGQEGKEIVNYEYYSDGYFWFVSELTHIYNKSRYSKPIRSGTLKIEDAFTTDDDGNDVTKYRERSPIGEANATLFPYEIASNYTRNLNTWEIENQNEKVLGHNTLVIKGKINKHNFQSFRFWVDKDTGILVKYETYNSSGEVVDYLHPTILEINVPIDSKRFTPNLENYKQETPTSEGSHVITGKIDGKIPKSLKTQWEDAKNKLDETTILHHDDDWYIHIKKGYLVDRIVENGKEGIVYMAKTSPQKSQFNFHTLLEDYDVNSLKIVYE